jgi:signal transduction histidine kinase/CheY-like chemotaxis protein
MLYILNVLDKIKCRMCIVSMLIGLTLTALVTLQLYKYNQAIRLNFFNEIATERHQEFIELTQRHERFLSSINAMLQTQHDNNGNLLHLIEITHTYVTTRNIITEFPGLFSMGLTYRVAADQLSETINLLQTKYPDFTYFGLPQDKRDANQEHWLVVYSQAIDDKSAVGFDSSTDPLTYRTILKAVSSSNIQSSPPLKLVEGNDIRSLSSISYLKLNLADDVVAYASLSLPQLLHALDITTRANHSPKFINTSFLSNDGSCQFSFTAGVGEVECNTQDINFIKPWHNYNIILQPSPQFEKLVPYQVVWPYPLFGLLVTFLVSFIIRIQTTRSFNLSAEVALRTQQLVEEKRKVEDAMHATQRFIANMSHELRTPLNGIMGINQILKSKITDKEITNFVDISQESANHLLLMVNDVLDISKLENDSLDIVTKSFNLYTMIETIQQTLTIGCNGKPIRPIFYVPTDLPKTVLGDQKRIKQILLNLASNALKFTDNGTIRFTVDSIQHTSDKVQLIFAISDTGIGIPKDRIANIFDRFMQVDVSNTRRHGGSGLGLAISQKLAHQMNGNITFESELGKGSTFTLTIDLAVQQSLNSLEPNAQAFSFEALAGLHIVVVDDVPTNTQITQILLENVGASVTVFNNSPAALDYCIQNKQHIDVLLCDIQMPELSGLNVSRRLRDGGFNKLIIGLSGNAFQSDIEEARLAGMDDYLAKPLDLAKCISCIENLCKTETKQKRLDQVLPG